MSTCSTAFLSLLPRAPKIGAVRLIALGHDEEGSSKGSHDAIQSHSLH